MRVIFYSFDPHNYREILTRMGSALLFNASVAIWVSIGFHIVLYWYKKFSRLINLLKYYFLRIELLNKIKKQQTSISFSLFFKRGIIITTVLSYTFVAIVGSLITVFRALLVAYAVVVGLLLLFQVVFLYYSGYRFYQLLHRNDSRTGSTIVSIETNSADTYGRYLSRVLRCLLLLATSLLLEVILLFFFTFYSKNPFAFLIFEILFRILDFSALMSVLIIATMNRPNQKSMTPSSSRISSAHFSLTQKNTL